MKVVVQLINSVNKDGDVISRIIARLSYPIHTFYLSIVNNSLYIFIVVAVAYYSKEKFPILYLSRKKVLFGNQKKYLTIY